MTATQKTDGVDTESTQQLGKADRRLPYAGGAGPLATLSASRAHAASASWVPSDTCAAVVR